MSLTILDPNVLCPLLTSMWQQELGTGEDPANGQWYTDGANGDGIGLYGGLFDSLPAGLDFDTANTQYWCEAVYCDAQGAFDVGPHPMVDLSYSYTNTVTTTQAPLTFIVGNRGSISGTATVFGIAGNPATETTIAYTHQWDQNMVVDSHPFQFAQTVALSVPLGRAYQAILAARVATLTIPFTFTIGIGGTTETWFENPIRGHYNWQMMGSAAFQNIGAWGIGPAPEFFTAAGVVQSGRLVAQTTSNFEVLVVDVTGAVETSGWPAARARRVPLAPGAAPGSVLLPSAAQLVQTISFPDPS